MLRIIRSIALCIFPVALAVAPASHAEVNDDYALKISLEGQIEKKLKQVIVEITGTDKVVIFVNAELVSKSGGGGRLTEKKSGDALVLPGVPAKKEFGAGQSSTAELMLPGSGKFSVNRIILSIWIDDSVPESIVTLIQDIAKNVIGFSQTRGDQIYVKRVDFESRGISWSSLFGPPNLFLLILSLVGGFALVMLGMFFMDPLKKVVPALKDIDWNLIRGNAAAGAEERISSFEREIVSAGPATVEKESGPEGAALPFSFIRERDLPGLAFLLRDKTAQDVAVVVNYLDPAHAMQLLDLFPKEKQVEVALLLGREELNIDKVHSLEDMVKGRLAYVIGGENKLITLLDMTNDEVRDKVVRTIETKDSQTAARLRRRIKGLDAIILELPALGIQTLYRLVDTALLAQILKSAPEDIRTKVISSLSAGAAERLKQEIELSRPLSSLRLKRERQGLMVTVRRLINEGLVEVENN